MVIHAYIGVVYRLMVIGPSADHATPTNGVDNMAIWQVRDISTSKGLPSDRRVVATFENLAEAPEFAQGDENFKIRAMPEKRRKKDEEDE